MSIKCYSRNFAVVAFAALALGMSPAWATKRAVLVGISDYQDNSVHDLEGPIYDVDVLRKVLLEKWGFTNENVATLVDAQATKKSILEAMKELVRVSKEGDTVLIYFSGHGLRAAQLDANVQTGVLFPYDFKRTTDIKKNAQSLIIAQRDYVEQVLKPLDAKQVTTWLVVDACFSGNAFRSGQDPREPMQRSTSVEVDLSSVKPTEGAAFGYKNVVFLAASSYSETAMDIAKADFAAYETFDKKPHGAFTDAWLRVLDRPRDANGVFSAPPSYRDVFRRTTQILQDIGIKQHPQSQPSASISRDDVISHPIFGEAAAPEAGQREPLMVSKLNTVDVQTDDLLMRNMVDASKVLQQSLTKDARYRVKKDGETWLVTDKGGTTLASFKEVDRQALVRAIEQYVWANQLVLDRINKGPGVDATFKNPAYGSFYPVGREQIYEVNMADAAKLAVLNVTPVGDVVVLFPITKAELKAQPGKTTIDFPVFAKPNTETGGETLLSIANRRPSAAWDAFFSAHLSGAKFGSDSQDMKSLKTLLANESDLSAFAHVIFSVDNED